MKRILILGSTGQLGSALSRSLYQFATVIGHRGKADGDLTDEDQVTSLINRSKPHLVVNCAAYNDVDAAENHFGQACAMNAVLPDILGSYCERWKIGLIHFSTDAVFDGERGSPYKEDDPTRPVNKYGESKLLGERVLAGRPAIVFRTSWLWSSRSDRPSFTNTIRSMIARGPVGVVDDVFGIPTNVEELSRAVSFIIETWREESFVSCKRQQGIYHLVSRGDACSKYDFAKEYLAGRNIPCQLVRIKSDAYPSKARRPKHIVLDTSKFKSTWERWRGSLMGDWRLPMWVIPF